MGYRWARKWFGEHHVTWTLFLVALVAHLAVFYALLYLYGPCSFFLSNDCTLNGNDTQHYVIIANNLAEGNGYSRFLDAPFEPDAYRTPLLVLYFLPFAALGGYSFVWLAIIFLNILLSLAAPLLYKFARLYMPHGYAVAAGLIMAFEPLYLYRSQIAEPDALFVLVLMAAMYFLARFWKHGWVQDIYRAFLLLGLSVLAKPSGMYIFALAVIFQILYVVFFVQKSWRAHAKTSLIAVAIGCAVVTPWLFRNYSTFGVPAVSSIQGYNLYEYYTESLKLPAESIPQEIQKSSREPSRYLPYQSYFTHVAFERIKNQPLTYAKDQAVGTLRNLFVSDIAQIYHYGHTRLLPFPYSPVSSINIHQSLQSGDFEALTQSVLRESPKLLWVVVLAILYGLALLAWAYAWGKDRLAFFTFTSFFCIYGYLLVASGPYVDAKYRLPGMPLVVIAALYGTYALARTLKITYRR